MDFFLPFKPAPLPRCISHSDRLLLLGSCFTEHMDARLRTHGFRTAASPHGILFNPMSVADALEAYADNRVYGEEDVFLLGELWSSWDHHTRFSNPDRAAALAGMNSARTEATAFLGESTWVIVTFGSAFQYFLTHAAESAGAGREGRPVSNNHRAPSQWFEKRLLSVGEIMERWNTLLARLFAEYPDLNVLFTISPVRHIRDGVVDNNRSKARLIEAVHALRETFAGRAHYFPAYEMVVDVLRDYRFYDADLVHPNYAATSAVWEAFAEACIAPEARGVMKEVADIHTAAGHRPRFPGTAAHRAFLHAYAQKTRALMDRHPALDLEAALQYFEGEGK